MSGAVCERVSSEYVSSSSKNRFVGCVVRMGGMMESVRPMLAVLPVPESPAPMPFCYIEQCTHDQASHAHTFERYICN